MWRWSNRRASPLRRYDADTATVVERTTPLETVAQAAVVVDGVATDDTVDAGLVPVAPG